jgi:hypothetical protein
VLYSVQKHTFFESVLIPFLVLPWQARREKGYTKEAKNTGLYVFSAADGPAWVGRVRYVGSENLWGNKKKYVTSSICDILEKRNAMGRP